MKSLVANKSRIGAVLAVILGGFLIGAAGIGMAVWLLANSLVDRYTHRSPRKMPTIEVTRGEIKALKNKWENFKSALKLGASSEKLELTSKELNVMLLTDPQINRFQGKVILQVDHQNVVNALLAEDETLQHLSGSFYITVRDGKIFGDISLPLSVLGLGDYDDRFMNASGEIIATLNGQKLRIRMDPREVNGEQLPKMVVSRVRELDLYDLFVKDHPVYGKLGARVKHVSVVDDQIHLELTEGNYPGPLMASHRSSRLSKGAQAVDEIVRLRNDPGRLSKGDDVK